MIGFVFNYHFLSADSIPGTGLQVSGDECFILPCCTGEEAETQTWKMICRAVEVREARESLAHSWLNRTEETGRVEWCHARFPTGW